MTYCQLVIRWARDETGEMVMHQGKRVLEAVLLTRRDTNRFAFPGGLIKPGESVLKTVRQKLASQVLGIDKVCK